VIVETPVESSLGLDIVEEGNGDDVVAENVDLADSNITSTSAFNYFIHDLPAVGGRSTYIKMCPFADNCVFGEKCRFSHSDVMGFQPFYPFAPKNNREANIYTSLSTLKPEEKIPICVLTKKLLMPINLM
jgi:hypothetical protein